MKIAQLREDKGLSLKDAAKTMGISLLRLSLYEKGVYKPSKKYLKILSDFYGEEISLEGEDSYSLPPIVKEKPFDKARLKKKRMISGIIALFMGVLMASGMICFQIAVQNPSNFYGEIYNRLEQKVKEQGEYRHEIITGLGYYTVDIEGSGSGISTQLSFYDVNSLLYFNETIYAINNLDPTLLIERYYFLFGGHLGSNSYLCNFSFTASQKFIDCYCTFVYEGGEISKISGYGEISDHLGLMDESLLIKKINTHIGRGREEINLAINSLLGEETDFYEDFLPAREKGRSSTFWLQAYGITAWFIGLIGFFASAWVFGFTLFKNYEHKHVEKEELSDEKKPLPKDINVPFGIPAKHAFIVLFAIAAITIISMPLGILSQMGVGLPSFLGNANFVNAIRYIHLIALFLIEILALFSWKNARSLAKIIVRNALIYFFLAAFETSLFGILAQWGYEVTSFLEGFIPVNTEGLFLCLSLMAFFLFVEPKFIVGRKKYIAALWHCIAIIPLAILLLFTRLGASYYLDYGVKKNIFMTIWFPSGYTTMMIGLAGYLVCTFLYRAFLVYKYGKGGAQIYFYGDRYNLIEALMVVLFIIVSAIVDVSLSGNQYANYMGIGFNYWFFALAVLFPFLKHDPTTLQNVVIVRREAIEEKEEISQS
ncbi:MAG: helix-turn-helix transcriptional regulator [Bacilli bacterium]|nr:helix-turn-helix transcriptional regulator [Bacilli bacterium]